MLTIFLILALVVAVIAVIFALQNTMPITVTFLVWKLDQSLALVLLMAIALGVIIGLLTISPTVIRSKIQLSSRKKKIDTLEKSLQEAHSRIEDQTNRITELEKPATPVEVVEDASSPENPTTPE